MAWGLSGAGFQKKTEAEILDTLLSEVESRLGHPIDRGPSSLFTRLLGAFARPLAEGWDAAEALWRASDIQQASGVALDELVATTGVARLPATRSMALVLCIGQPGTQLAAGRAASVLGTGARFRSIDPVTLTASLWGQTITVRKVQAGARYRVLAGGIGADLVALEGESPEALARRLGDALRAVGAPVLVEVDRERLKLSARRLNEAPALVAQVLPCLTARVEISQVLANTAYEIEVRDQSGNVQARGSVTTGAASAGSPPNLGTIVTNLANDTSSPVITATPSPDLHAMLLRGPSGTFTIQSWGPLTARITTPSPADLLTAEATQLGAAEVWMEAETTGPVEAPRERLSRIETPSAGWERVVNPADAEPGRDIEGDSDLRIRQRRSLQIAGFAVRESIAARLRQTIPGLTAVLVIENDKDTPTPEGMPPHSFEVVVDAPALPEIDQLILQTLWETKPAGIGAVCQLPAPYRVEGIVRDSQGFEHTLRFSRPVPVPILMEIGLRLHPEERFPDDGIERVREKILSFGRAHTIGQDIVLDRFLGPIFEVPGIYDVVFQRVIYSPTLPVGADNVSIIGRALAVFEPHNILINIVT